MITLHLLNNTRSQRVLWLLEGDAAPAAVCRRRIHRRRCPDEFSAESRAIARPPPGEPAELINAPSRIHARDASQRTLERGGSCKFQQ
jgi:hypothetical protein